MSNDGIWGRSSIVGGQKYVILTSKFTVARTMQAFNSINVSAKHMQSGTRDGSRPSEDVYIINAKDVQEVLELICFQTPDDWIVLDPAGSQDKRAATRVPMRMDRGYLYAPDWINARVMGKLESISAESRNYSDQWWFDLSTKTFFAIK